MAKKKIKDWYKSKTLWKAILLGIAGVVGVLLGEFEISAKVAGAFLVADKIMDIALRFFTGEPIQFKLK